MLPMSAMPSAVPISRVVSLTALATPCFAVGSELTIAFVAGVMARPMPDPEEHLGDEQRRGSRCSASSCAKATMPAPVTARPIPLTSFIP